MGVDERREAVKVQMSGGSVIEVKHHKLSGKQVVGKYWAMKDRKGTVVGICKGAKSARQRHAFIVDFVDSHGYHHPFTMSRASFTVLD